MRVSNLSRLLALACAFLLLATGAWAQGSASTKKPNYARVLEIPTPRWTAYDAAYFKVQMSANVPMITQERAFTSPIWYTPR